MGRISTHSTGKISARAMENRLRLLTILVGAQLVLTVAIITLLLTGGSFKTDKEPAMNNGEMAAEEVSDSSFLVEETPVAATLPEERTFDRPLRVQILNGCGVPGIASKFSDVLKRHGLDVREVGNAKNQNYSKSEILDRTQIDQKAESFAQMMGISVAEVKDSTNPDLVDIDVTLVIGKDYNSLKLHP
ncbi:LytR C-terminal domain-containing protein [bacterium]|nr:LytR C-terminal domain-containing protein [bacterium]